MAPNPAIDSNCKKTIPDQQLTGGMSLNKIISRTDVEGVKLDALCLKNTNNGAFWDVKMEVVWTV